MKAQREHENSTPKVQTQKLLTVRRQSENQVVIFSKRNSAGNVPSVNGNMILLSLLSLQFNVKEPQAYCLTVIMKK